MKLFSVGSLFTSLILFFSPVKLFARDSLIAEIRIPHLSFMAVDPNGNIYAIGNQNTFLRYSPGGDSTGYYNNIQNGELAWADVSNPLKILLFYPQFSKIVILDNMLSPKAVINLQQLGLVNVSACGMAEDGNIWVYDNFKSRLLKINTQLETISESNDLRSETGTVPTPTSLLAIGGKVYLCDTTNGVYVFDRYGSFLNKLEIKGMKQLQVFNQQFVWFSKRDIQSYDSRSFKSRKVHLPKGVLNAMISRNKRLYLQYSNKIVILNIQHG